MKEVNVQGLLERIAKRRSESPGFEICMMRVRKDRESFEVEGAVPRILTRGPRQGEKTWWNTHRQRFVVTIEQLDAEATAYESETGNCARCFGKGEVFARWHHETGTTYRPCPSCGATGKRSAA